MYATQGSVKVNFFLSLTVDTTNETTDKQQGHYSCCPFKQVHAGLAEKVRQTMQFPDKYFLPLFPNICFQLTLPSTLGVL